MLKSIKEVIKELSGCDTVKEKQELLSCMLLCGQINSKTKIDIENYLNL